MREDSSMPREPDSRAPRPRASLLDVATAAGVSRTTASAALSGNGRMSAETRARVRSAALDLGFRPSLRAQRLRTGRSRTIALASGLPRAARGTAIDWVLDLAGAAAQASADRGYSLLLVPPLNASADLIAHDIEGVILVDALSDGALARQVAQHGVAVVSIGADERHRLDGNVERGDFGASIMVDHLVSRGARHIALLLTAEPYVLADAVRAGATGRAAAAGVAVTVVTSSVADGAAGVFDAISRALGSDPTIDAVYAPLEGSAIGALDAARACGRAVPDDLLLATNYDGRLAGAANPPVTALDLNLPELARLAAQLLFDRLEGAEPAVRTAPTPRIIARSSTASARVRHPRRA